MARMPRYSWIRYGPATWDRDGKFTFNVSVRWWHPGAWLFLAMHLWWALRDRYFDRAGP